MGHRKTFFMVVRDGNCLIYRWQAIPFDWGTLKNACKKQTLHMGFSQYFPNIQDISGAPVKNMVQSDLIPVLISNHMPSNVSDLACSTEWFLFYYHILYTIEWKICLVNKTFFMWLKKYLSFLQNITSSQICHNLPEWGRTKLVSLGWFRFDCGTILLV